MTGFRRLSLRAKIVRAREEAFVKQNELCFWCDKQMLRSSHKPLNKDEEDLMCTAEHVTKRADGGSAQSRKNIVAAHKKCNNERG